MVSGKRSAESEAFPELPQRRVTRKIGSGASVTTYAAVHLPTDREEFVKVARLRELPPRFVDAYLEEYRKLSELQQRNVVSVYEVGRIPEGAFVAFESLAGGPLSEAIRRKLQVGLALNCLAQMCLALDAIHELEIFHGALRAEHFLFRQDRVLVLADFNTTERVNDSLGLAYSGTNGVLRRRTTRTAPRRAGPQLDFHALGRILYAMLTGDTSLITGSGEEWRADNLFNATRLPLPLSPLQPCLDGLLGMAAHSIERAEDVLVELLAVKDSFPFDTRPAESRDTPFARELGKR